MNHASLFSGIGGFDLAAQWAGWTNLIVPQVALQIFNAINQIDQTFNK